MTVKQASDKWGVSLRYTQRLLADGRIPNAKKYGRSWVIPVDASKPIDPRKKPGLPQKPPDYPPYLALLWTIKLPPPEAIMQAVEDEALLCQYQGELAYMRGDFATAKRRFTETAADDPIRICAAMTSIIAAISTNDYPLYIEIETYLKDLVQTNPDTRAATLAENILATVAVSLFAPNMSPEWLKNGNLYTLPPETMPLALYLRVKYLNNLAEYSQMLAVAQTALAIYKGDGCTLLEIYLRLMCAIAYVWMGEKDLARPYLRESMALGLPYGFITPFAETAPALGGLVEELLQRQYPHLYDAVIDQWQATWKNWAIFHNRFTQDNVPLILNLREFRIAYLAATRVPYAKIAEQEGVSLGRLRNIMQEIYSKLLISNRKQLAELILWFPKKT